MKVMTFNLRFENDRDGENSWGQRRHMVVDVIRKYAPAILGTQEGTPRQLEYLQDRLPQYRMYTPQRTWDETCQYPTLFYRTDRLNALAGGEFWLSLTPRIHRSKDWDSAFPRMMSYALLREEETSRTFWAVVTHLDHLGSQARLEQTRMLVEWLKERSEPRLLMGDFNDRPGSPLHALLTNPETQLEDSWYALGKEENEHSMTHHNFGGTPGKFRMDWILTSPELEVLDAFIVRDHEAGRYPSDHFPYLVELRWKDRSAPRKP